MATDPTDAANSSTTNSTTTNNASTGSVAIGGDVHGDVNLTNTTAIQAQTNIAGSASGPVLSGTFHGPITITTAPPPPAANPPAQLPITNYQSPNPTLPNPFLFGPAVSPDKFFGRADTLAFLRNRLGAVEPGWVSIVGFRRMGKTSLLRVVHETPHRVCLPAQNPLPVFVDLTDSRHHTPTGLMEKVRRELARALGPTPWPPAANDDLYAVEDGLQRVRQDGHRLLLLLDEFEAIGQHLAQFENWGSDMRALGGQGLLTLVTASQRPIPDIYTTCGLTSPFVNVFAETQLGALPAAEWHALVQAGFATAQRTPTAAEWQWLDDLAGGWPFYVQMAAHALWQHGDLPAAQAEFEHQAQPRWRELWDALTPLERRALGGEPGGLRQAPPAFGLAKPPSDPSTLSGSSTLSLSKGGLARGGLLRPDGRAFSAAFVAFARGQV